MAREFDPYSQHTCILSSLKMGRFIFICVSSRYLLLHLEHLEPSEQSNRDDIEDAMDIDLLSLPNHGLGKGKETGATEVIGPFVSYYALSL